jgi:hypothetical protein
MARFFERLLGEEDPSRFAAMAENLPEPPSFDVDVALAEAATLTLPEPEPVAVAEPTPEPEVATPFTDAVADQQTSEDPETAFAAIQAAAEAAAVAESAATETASADAWPAETDETTAAGDAAAGDAAAGDAVDGEAVAEAEADADPLLGFVGLNADSAAAAEAEAFAIDPAAAEVEEIPDIAEDALAARLAGLVPTAGGDTAPASETNSTQVVVVGLVSVASIASFKRHLGRLPGVQSVGVSSGPDGEFVFAVTHGPEVALGEAIPSLPGFQPRVTASGDGVVHVTAHDPESDA